METESSQTQLNECDICGNTFKGKRGLLIHISKAHKEVQNSVISYDEIVFQFDDNSINKDISQTHPTQNAECYICGQTFKGERGVSIHISKAHKKVQNLIISEKYCSKEDPNISECSSQSSHCNSKKSVMDSYNLSIEELCLSLQSYEEFNPEEFDDTVTKFITILKNANIDLPGPKHPATKFYAARKNKAIFKSSDSNYKKTSNPQTDSKRARERRKYKYKHDVIQHLFYNQRKKCVKHIMSDIDNSCKIPIQDLHEHFSSRWSTYNTKIRDDYNIIPIDDQIALDSEFDPSISEDEIKWGVSKIRNDSSPGNDGIYPRTLKLIKCERILSIIGTIMLTENYIPESLKEARTVLIYKDKGDRNDPKNWRPITISSVVRRCIEKVLERKLRRYISFNPNQKGFIDEPGCHINSSIVSGCLKEARKLKKSCVINFLDIQLAYDSVGHAHLEKSLLEEPIPCKLRNIAMSLQTENWTRLDCNGSKSKLINLNQGIFQGSSLSPILFNSSINYVINSLSDEAISKEYGYQLLNGMSVSVLSFVDDTAPVSNSRESAATLYNQANSEFSKCGLKINPIKSKVIIIENGTLSEDDLIIDPLISIAALKKDEIIKYLGVSYKSEVIINEAAIIKSFQESLDKLISTPTLYPDQKIDIINQYIWPQLVYTFQTCPLAKLKNSFITNIDKIIRNSAKVIASLPDDIPSAMLYSPRKFKGIGLMKANWEVFIQSFNICNKLISVKNPVVNYFRDLKEEKSHCLNSLEISEGDINEIKTKSKSKNLNFPKILRKILREREFEKWCALPSKGRGVTLFSEVTYANSWMENRRGLSANEWITSIKMNGDVCAVRALPGRSQDNNRCRYSFCNERESLGHILGFCSKGELLRNNRHHRVRSLIANALRDEDWTVFEEAHCLSDDGSNRRFDILAIKNSSAILLDPTIRIETHKNQPKEVDVEKKSYYEPCIPYLKVKYKVSHIEVIGLMIGARGTIPLFFEDFRKRFKLKKLLTKDIVLSVIKDSVSMLNFHLFSQNK